MFHSLKSVFSICLCMALTGSLSSQELRNRSTIYKQVYLGKILKHSAKFSTAITEPTYMMELGVSKQNDYKHNWHTLFPGSSTGLSFIYSYFGNHNTYGKAYGLLWHFTIPLKLHEKYRLNYRIGFGPAYLNRPFAQNGNANNTVIGSKANGMVQFMAGGQYHIKQNLDVFLNGSFTHFSNGKAQLPNLGINVYALSTGITYYFNQRLAHQTKILKPKRPQRINFETQLSYAFNENKAIGGPKNHIYILSFGAGKHFSRVYKLNLGLTYAYNTGVKNYINLHENYDDKIAARSMKLALYAGNEFVIGKLSIIAQAAYYLYNPFLKAADIYFKVGAKYYLKPYYSSKHNFYAIGLLKSHYATADFIEFGIGTTF